MQIKFFVTKLLRERRPGVLPLTPKQSDRVLNGLWDNLSAEETEIPKVPHQDHVDNFFVFLRLIAQRIHTTGKTVNTEFYKGVLDRLLKRIQRVSPAAFCSRDFLLLQDNAPANNAARVCQFFTPKNVTTLCHPHTLQIYLLQIIFCSPSWKCC
jgi:hypothetical protein